MGWLHLAAGPRVPEVLGVFFCDGLQIAVGAMYSSGASSYMLSSSVESRDESELIQRRTILVLEALGSVLALPHD